MKKASRIELLKTLEMLRQDAKKYPDGRILEMAYAASVVRIGMQFAFDQWGQQKKAP